MTRDTSAVRSGSTAMRPRGPSADARTTFARMAAFTIVENVANYDAIDSSACSSCNFGSANGITASHGWTQMFRRIRAFAHSPSSAARSDGTSLYSLWCRREACFWLVNLWTLRLARVLGELQDRAEALRENRLCFRTGGKATRRLILPRRGMLGG